MSTLLLRTLTALVLFPVVIFALIAQGIWFKLTAFIFASACIYEWIHVCFFKPQDIQDDLTAKEKISLFMGGFIYILLAFFSLFYIQSHDIVSPHLLIWLLILVSVTDIGAYFVGSYFKGPLLAPHISPKKTWSGFLGGWILGTLAAWGYAYGADLAIYYSPWIYMWASALSLAGQIGDLLESWAKRLLHVKDSGRILPGHGGILDRMDSTLLVLSALALILWLFYV